MDFAFVIDDKYVNMMLVTMQSIIENNSGNHRVFIFTSGLSETNIHKIHCCMQKWNCRDSVVRVDDSCLDNVPILRSDFNKTPYYKLLITEYIPDDVDKLLYIDSDIIVNRSLANLFSLNLKDFYFAAVPDILRNTHDDDYLRSLGIDKSKGERYFNSGLILFNMKVFKENYGIEDALTYIRNHGHAFKYHDQEVLNALFFKDYLQLPEEYNTFASFISIRDIIKYIVNREYRTANSIYIIHYANRRLKPWNDNYVGKYEGLFWKYASHSPVYGEIKDKRKNKLSKQIAAITTRILNIIKR